MFCTDIMRATKDAVPNKAPNASEPRQAHPISSVLFESYDDYAESWLVHLNDAVIMGQARHLPVNDVITPKDSVDVFLRYWCPDYPDSCGIGRQRCNTRSDWRNLKSDKEIIITLHRKLTPPLGRFDGQSSSREIWSLNLSQFQSNVKVQLSKRLQFLEPFITSACFLHSFPTSNRPICHPKYTVVISLNELRAVFTLVS